MTKKILTPNPPSVKIFKKEFKFEEYEWPMITCEPITSNTAIALNPSKEGICRCCGIKVKLNGRKNSFTLTA